MRRAASLKAFVIGLFIGVVLLTLAWTRVSPWTSYPAGMVAGVALERTAPGWVREARLAPGRLEVDTSVAIATPQTGNQPVEITLESDPGRYAYGLPIFLALLLAARGPGRTVRALAGYALLLPLQAFSLCMQLLMQLLLTAQFDVRTLRVAQWQMEALVYGYQLGSLVVPTLAPILVWLWLDRAFVNEVVIGAWKRSLSGRAVVPAGAPEAAAPVPGEAAAPAPAVASGPAAEAPATGAPLPPERSIGGVPVSSSASAGLPPRRPLR
ncbi:exosortase H-associated membrane protein [Paracidovorax oryzae]|uniref:exosortase H-associated membrane protein n=1 Tax=Paracidovorax oryzae TaxID=862720 RepID=UPI00047EC44D|nr:exosortase H-associated membrane protein [Paracidovorax oryzae]